MLRQQDDRPARRLSLSNFGSLYPLARVSAAHQPSEVGNFFLAISLHRRPMALAAIAQGAGGAGELPGRICRPPARHRTATRSF